MLLMHLYLLLIFFFLTFQILYRLIHIVDVF